MNLRKITTTVVVGSLLSLLMPVAFAAQDPAVVTAINTFKANNPNLPSVTNQKGNL